MIRITLMEPEKFVIDEVPDPEIEPGEALIRVKSNGICGGDVAPYVGKKLDIFPLPSVLGHEFGGIVEDIKGNAGEVRIGDKVAVYPALPCGNCYYCTRGMGFACNNMRFYGVGGTDGGFAEMFKAPIDNCVVLDKEFELTNIGIIEPATVALKAIGEFVNSTLAIYGVGSIGMLMIQIAKSNNNKIVAIDIDQKHLETARLIGADLVVDANDASKNAIIRKYLDSERDEIDAIILTVCSQEVLDWAINNVRKVGTIKNITVMDSVGLSVNFNQVWTKQLTISGQDCYTQEQFRKAARLVEEGIIKKEGVITKYFPLAEVEEAFKYRVNENALKVILTG